MDIASVGLLLTAILPSIYAIKEFAKAGVTPLVVIVLAVGVAGILGFVRRQRKLSDPLLDLQLFTSRTYTAALIILLVGLIGVAGMMLLVTQYLQLVAGYSPLVAGLWMGPPALMMVLAGVLAPLFARRFRPAFVIAGALVFSSIGCGMLALVDAGTVQVSQVVIGFSLVYLGLGTIAALGTDLVVGAAPSEKAGSASAMSEMVQELGVAFGVALLGSLATLLYRVQIASSIPAEISDEANSALGDSLWATKSVADQLPAGMLEQSQQAFTQGMTVVATVSGVAILGLALLSVAMLRHVKAIGDNQDGA
jgi:DHA2 family multidrug resistance protein-like MFS transporter